VEDSSFPLLAIEHPTLLIDLKSNAMTPQRPTLAAFFTCSAHMLDKFAVVAEVAFWHALTLSRISLISLSKIVANNSKGKVERRRLNLDVDLLIASIAEASALLPDIALCRSSPCIQECGPSTAC
jgi:hypothetical protein